MIRQRFGKISSWLLRLLPIICCWYLLSVRLAAAQPLDAPKVTTTTTTASASSSTSSSLPASSSSGRTIKRVERHLIIMGCKSSFWSNIKDMLEERIDFDTSVCIYSEEEEAINVDRIKQRKLADPELDIHVVAALITRNHCSVESQDQCRAVNTGDNYLELLESGVTGWFLENEPNFEALGVNRTAAGIQSTELFPDNSNGGNQVAQEFCRLGASIAPATIAVLYGAQEAAHSTARIQSFIDGLEEYCPEARHQIKYSFYADWSAEKAAALMSPIFLQDGAIDAVIAANDDMALGALVSAKEMRPDKQLLVAGYDANSYTIPLLQSGAMFATVDQSPPTGIAYSLQVMLSDQANGGTDFGDPTDCALNPNPDCGLEDYNTIRSASWNQLTNDLPNKVQTAVTIRVKDPSSLVLRERLLLYNNAVRPPSPDNSPTPVTAQLLDTKVFELHTGSSSILAQAVLVLKWEDTRLRWSELIHPDVPYIRMDIEDIWSPTVILSNLLNSGFTVPMTDIQTTLYPNGTIIWKQTVNTGEFRCRSIEENVFKFPFDTQMCGIDLTSYSISDFKLKADEDDFDVEVANNDWFEGPVEVVVEPGAQQETIEYRVEMERDPLFIVLSIIVPSFLLNTISFAQHWIPTRTGSINLDRGGMAITTILAALALRDTMVAEVGNAFTLLDLFLLVSLVFQFLGFLITTYESSYGRVKGSNEDELGIGDRLGKVVTPLLFGLFCLSLSIYWGNGVWILFYLAIILILLTGYLGRTDHHRFRQKLRERISKSKNSLSKKLGLAGLDVDGEDDDKATAENVVRYLRWQAFKRKELESRRDLGLPDANDDELHDLEESILFEEAPDLEESVKALQRSFRNLRTSSRMTGNTSATSLSMTERHNNSLPSLSVLERSNNDNNNSQNLHSYDAPVVERAPTPTSMRKDDTTRKKPLAARAPTPTRRDDTTKKKKKSIVNENDAAKMVQRAFRNHRKRCKSESTPAKSKQKKKTRFDLGNLRQTFAQKRPNR